MQSVHKHLPISSSKPLEHLIRHSLGCHQSCPRSKCAKPLCLLVSTAYHDITKNKDVLLAYACHYQMLTYKGSLGRGIVTRDCYLRLFNEIILSSTSSGASRTLVLLIPGKSLEACYAGHLFDRELGCTDLLCVSRDSSCMTFVSLRVVKRCAPAVQP